MKINGPSGCCKTPDDELNEKSEFEIIANTVRDGKSNLSSFVMGNSVNIYCLPFPNDEHVYLCQWIRSDEQ